MKVAMLPPVLAYLSFALLHAAVIRAEEAVNEEEPRIVIDMGAFSREDKPPTLRDTYKVANEMLGARLLLQKKLFKCAPDDAQASIAYKDPFLAVLRASVVLKLDTKEYIDFLFDRIDFHLDHASLPENARVREPDCYPIAVALRDLNPRIEIIARHIVSSYDKEKKLRLLVWLLGQVLPSRDVDLFLSQSSLLERYKLEGEKRLNLQALHQDIVKNGISPMKDD